MYVFGFCFLLVYYTVFIREEIVFKLMIVNLINLLIFYYLLRWVLSLFYKFVFGLYLVLEFD